MRCAPEDRADIEDGARLSGRIRRPPDAARTGCGDRSDVTVGEVIDQVRATIDPATDFWEIFVIDATRRPIGTMRLSWLLTTPPAIAVADIMQREQTLIPVTMDQEEVALQFQKYALISAAVVDAGGRLVGVITVDDIVHIIQEEAGEDALKLSGAGDGDINEPVIETYKARIRWLVANLGTAMVSSSVIAAFEPTIEKFVVLAALTPDRRQRRRQCRHPDDGGGGARARHQPVDRNQHPPDDLARNPRRHAQRQHDRAADGAGHGLLFGNVVLGLVIAAAVLFNIMVAGRRACWCRWRSIASAPIRPSRHRCSSR